MVSKSTRSAAIVLTALIFIAGITLFNLNTLVAARGRLFDFYPHWVGGRTFWSGQSPYTPEITRQIQIGMYGETLPPDADQQNFAYPVYTSIIIAPVIALPASLSIAIWMAIQLVSCLIAPVIWLIIVGWKPSPLLFFVLILGLVFAFHYPIDTFVLGQFSGTVLLGISLGVWLLARGQDTYAGLVFVLATVPPTVGAPIAGIILFVFALHGRWHGLAAFMTAMLLLVGFSILRIGWWIPDWLNVVRRYSNYAPPVWPPNFLPFPLNILLVGGIIVLFFGSIFHLWRTISSDSGKSNAQRYVVDLPVNTLLVGLLLLPQTGYYYLVLLIPVIVACLSRARSLPSGQRWLIQMLCILAVVIPWVYSATPAFNPDTQSLIMPLYTGLIWGIANFHPRKSQPALN